MAGGPVWQENLSAKSVPFGSGVTMDPNSKYKFEVQISKKDRREIKDFLDFRFDF